LWGQDDGVVVVSSAMLLHRCYRDANNDTLPVTVIGADADDMLAAQQPSYYSLHATTA
jgi:hypothetical protein